MLPNAPGFVDSALGAPGGFSLLLYFLPELEDEVIYWKEEGKVREKLE